LRPHEVVIVNQFDDLIGENHHDFTEQDGDVRCPSDAVEIDGILGLLLGHGARLLATLVLVLLVTVDECVIEQQRQHNVEHQEQRVRITGIPSALEHDQHVIVQTEELQQLQGEQRSRVQNENRSRFVHFVS